MTHIEGWCICRICNKSWNSFKWFRKHRRKYHPDTTVRTIEKWRGAMKPTRGTKGIYKVKCILE